MATPDLDYGDATEDPKAQADVARVFADSAPAAPPPPPTQDHPMVQFAKGILAPMYGQQNVGNVPKAAPLDFSGGPANPFDVIGNDIRRSPAGALTLNNPMFARPEHGTPPIGEGAANMLSNVPVLGGIGNFGTRQLQQGPLSTYILGSNPDYNAIQAMPAGPEKTQALEDFDQSQALNVVSGAVGALENTAAKEVRYIVNAGKTRSYVTDTLTGKDEPHTFGGKDHAAQAQASADQLNASAQAAKTMAAPEAQMSAALNNLTNVKTTDGNLGRTVRVAARNGMTEEQLLADPTMQGQIMAALARAKLPASDENIAALGQRILAQEKARPTVGNRNVAEAQGAVAEAFSVPKPINVPASAEQAAAEAGTQTAAQQAQNNILSARVKANLESDPGYYGYKGETQKAAPPVDSGTGGENPIDFGTQRTSGAGYPGGGKPPEGPPLTATGGGSRLPPQPPRGLAQAAGDAAKAALGGVGDVLTNVVRAIMITGHVPLRQAAPLLADTVLRQNPVAAARSLGRMVADTAGGVAKQDIFDRVYAGQKQLLEGAGIKSGTRYRGAEDLLTQSHGLVSATEEYTIRGLMGTRIGGSVAGAAIGATQGDTPDEHLRNALIGAGAGALVPNLNRVFPSVLNSLRTSAAVDLAKMQMQSRGFVKSDEIVHAVRIASGRGDLPGGAKTAKVLNGVLFGPRLLTSSWQYPAEAIKAIGQVGSDVLSRKPLNSSEVMKIRSLAAYVAAGVGYMKLASASGLDVETNADSRDWGRIVLPDGSRLDLWGQFGPDARLITRAASWLNQTEFGIGTPLRPNKFSQETAADMIGEYFRNKLGPAGGLVANVMTGKTGAGKPFVLRDELGKAAADPLSYASANAPKPFAVEQADLGGSGENAALKVALVAAGASVINTPRHINYDGLGAAEGAPNYQSGSILETYANMVNASKTSSTPWHGGDPVMAAPRTTIGTGANEIKLDPKTADRYTKAVGDARDRALGPLVNSAAFQALPALRQQEKFDAAVKEADKTASEQFLAKDLITATDPKAIAAEALQGFIEQGSSLHDRAYWVATLDRAGKLTPDVAKAIDTYENQLASSEKRAPITVAEYKTAAPIVHQYLAHAPYGTDAHPIGNQADWTAVDTAKTQQANERDRLIRAGMDPTQAHYVAQNEVMASLTPTQRSLLVNGSALENPQRRVMAMQYRTMLTRFLGSNPSYTQESDATYQNYPQN